jgi:ketosteroid isomerase-like protein
MSSEFKPVADKERQLRQALQEWSHAYVTRDMKVLDRARAEDWTYQGSPTGEIITKAQADRLLADDPSEYLSFDYDDLTIRFFGETAVATSRQTIRYRLEGEVHTLTLSSSITLVKQAKRWRAVASHTSAIGEETWRLLQS